MKLPLKCKNIRPRKINGVWKRDATCDSIVGRIDPAQKEFDDHYCKNCKTFWGIEKRDGELFMFVIAKTPKFLETLSKRLRIRTENYNIKIN